MKFYLFILCGLFVPTLLQAEIYRVRKGDSLWALSSQHGIPSSTIKKLNELSRDQLQTGQKIFIPKEIISYQVKNGETLASIAGDNNISPAYIITLNNLTDDMLAEGQSLQVPLPRLPVQNAEGSPAARSPARKSYRVRRGDTLSSIALENKVSLASLKAWNNKKDSFIRIGEDIYLEGARAAESQRVSSAGKGEAAIVTNVSRHVVRPNDTLSALALRYKVSQKDILKWNKKRNTVLYRGESLRILTFGKSDPAKNSPAAAPSSTYTVRRGDNLRIIADRYRVSVRSLKSWNNKTSDLIYVGEKLKIYGAVATSPKMKTIVYTVKRGDTLDGIALKMKTTRKALMAANNKKTSSIQAGERLKVQTPVQASAARSRVVAKKKTAPRPAPPQGIKSARFKGIPLPVAQSELKTAAPSGRGADIYLKSQTDLKTPTLLTVEYAGYINALQNVVILKDDDDRTLIYAGLEDLRVETGQRLPKGHVIGRAGYSTIDDSAKIYLELRDKAEVANVFHSYQDLAKVQKK